MKKLVVFSAEGWCSNCKVLHKSIEAAKLEIPVNIIDVDKDPLAAKEFLVRGVPTVLLMEDNQVIKRSSGSMTASQLVEFCQ
jgi:thioredoxin 1